jgi:diaminopimelate epimerase
MSGAGNDFVVLGRGAFERLAGDAEWIRRVCRRGLSVGADGVLFVDPVGPDRVRVEFRNPDGSSAFCGNGTRCAARYAQNQGWVGTSMVLETEAGDVTAKVHGRRVRLTLPPPNDLGPRTVRAEARELDGRHILAGVPHFVVWVDSLAEAPLGLWGRAVRNDDAFAPDGVNLDLVQTDPAGAIRVRTWERGVEGETLACGSGAVAVAFASRLRNGAETATVVPRSGIPLEIRLPGPADRPESAVVEGDARVIFEAELPDEATSGFGTR